MKTKTLREMMMVLTLLSAVGAKAQSDYSTAMDASKNQAVLTLTDDTKRYYNTESVSSIDFSGADVTVNQAAGSYTYNNVRTVAFSKAQPSGDGEINNPAGAVQISEAKAWLESAYVKFEKFTGAKTYNVYVKGGQYSDYTKIDAQLVRDYGSYGRADALGLKAGTYSMKVVAVNESGTEIAGTASEATGLQVVNFSREGFAFMGYTPGAYNEDGTLKNGAKVLYVTKQTAKTISTNVTGADSNPCVGLQHIIDAYQKGKDTTPIVFRIIGLIEKSDLDGISSSEEGIQIKGKNADSEMPITIEGVGDDATVRGFGFLVRNSKGVEFRNFGIMRCMDDGISMDTYNSNIWVHHMDVFYGPNGSGDHAKGDGSVDVKKDSKYVTVSYNHYWDTGKTNMFGMKEESGPNYISYDHNWFDHSDSRHPRVRTMSVHVWNNYFDNVAKYGVGATTGASVFVENNYFLNTKKPILTSMQGTDAKGSGTFSSEDGGMIKAYGNYFDKTAKNFSYYTQANAGQTGYDAYETATRDAKVPATEVAKQGGTAYNNFDTDAGLMYRYTVDDADAVPGRVTGYYGAGRMNHGDFSYSFKDNTGSDSDDSAYDTTLGGMLDNYKTALVGICGEDNASQGSGDNPGTGDNPSSGTVTPGETVTCSFDKNGTPSNSLFTVTGNGSNSKGTATVDGVEYKTCLKLESATSIKFTLPGKYKMTLYFGSQDTNYTIKIDGKKQTGANGVLEATLEAGDHELTKADSGNLFYIKLVPVE